MMRFYLSLYLFITAVYLLSASGRIGLADGVAMFNVAQSVVNERSLSAEPCDPKLFDEQDMDPGNNHGPVCIPGVDGRYYAAYGLVPSLLAAPALLCGGRIARLLHISPLVVLKVSVSVFTVLVSSLACVVLAMWIVRLGYSRRTAMWGAFILAFASPFWHFGVKGFFSEPYFTLALLLATYLLSSLELPFAAALSGLAFGAACGCRINGIILFPVFILFLAFLIRARGLTMTQFFREAALFSTSFSVCAGLIGWANYARFGSPLKTGYHLYYPSLSPLFSTPLFDGMSGLLFNGAVGLLVFAPWVLVGLICFPSFVRAHLPESVLCGTIFLFNFLFYAKSEVWHGGWVAGPRYLTPTLPFLVMVMMPCIERLQGRGAAEQWPRPWAVLRTATMILLIAGAVIQSLGVLYPEERYYVLMTFYEDKPARPWWAGSIPLASIEFLPRVAAVNAWSVKPVKLPDQDQLAVARERAEAWAAMNKVNTEEDFLRSLPNSENYTLPNLMLYKMRLLGLPGSAVCGYGVSVALVGLIGLVGLKRCAAPIQG